MVNEYPRLVKGTKRRWTGGAEEPNHLLAAFPVLFPYGLGGFEVDREQAVSYEQHSRWALLYDDKRFRVDLQFVFQVFGVQMKWQVFTHTCVQIKRSSYKKHAAAIAQLTAVDFAKASEEEANHVHFSNPTVQLFRGHLTALRSSVMGTDESRRAIRAQIWGCTLVNGPPALWITINPSDIHDPIAQFLVGEDIDLDNFLPDLGPDRQTRAYNIAEDPFAACEFFHTVVASMLEHLFGISGGNHTGRSHVKRRPGVLGTVQAYNGTVEAQMRGMLHLHLMVWLAGAPTSQEMSDLLQREEFREKLRLWIQQHITADIAGMSAADIEGASADSACSFSRPLDPRSDDFHTSRGTVVRRLATSLQVHSCKGRGCLKRINGKLRCKRRAPFECAPAAWVSEAGEWGPARLHAMVVAFNPEILLNIRCNHDIKLLTNAHNTSGISWYITFYATKKQQNSGNASAVLARRLAYHQLQQVRDPDVDELNRKMINRCANALSREQEFSAPEVIGYLMGWGDRYISHHYVTIYWDSIIYSLKARFPELRRTS